MKANNYNKILQVGDSVIINKIIAKVLLIDRSYGLLKFPSGIFCYNILGIKDQNIIKSV